jgi:hypothetical protein
MLGDVIGNVESKEKYEVENKRNNSGQWPWVKSGECPSPNRFDRIHV